MASSNLTLKVILISTMVVSVGVTMKLAVPLMLNFAVYDLPAIWSILVSWLKPPYLYLLINGIIITIAASTRFPLNHNHSQQQLINPLSEFTTETTPLVMVIENTDPDVVATTSTWHPSDSELKSPKFNYPVREKQILTSRFAHNRKPTPHGARALRVLKPKKHEIMDSTWKMITDGRHTPLNRHLRKSDTFVNVQQDRHSTEFKKMVKKSETFKDRTNYEKENHYLQPSSTNSSPASGGKLKKDGSLSHDELNHRVEAFIKKFNDDMRLQRQQSLNQYRGDMVNRGLR